MSECLWLVTDRGCESGAKWCLCASLSLSFAEKHTLPVISNCPQLFASRLCAPVCSDLAGKGMSIVEMNKKQSSATIGLSEAVSELNLAIEMAFSSN